MTFLLLYPLSEVLDLEKCARLLVIPIISHLLANAENRRMVGGLGAHTSLQFSVQLIAAAGLIRVELSLDVSSQQDSQSETLVAASPAALEALQALASRYVFL